RVTRQAGERVIEDLAANVVEVDVDPLRSVLAQSGGKISGLVVDRRIETQVLHHVAALLGAARDPHDAAALQLGDLPDDASDGAGGAGYDDGLSLGRTAD